MNARRQLCAVLLMLYTFSACSSEGNADKWSVAATIALTAANSTSDHTMTATLTNMSSGESFQTTTPTYIEQIRQEWFGGDKVVIVGHGEWPDEAIVIDTKLKRVLYRALGYGMRILGDRWLVSEEFFPPHIPPSLHASDVLLVRHLLVLDRLCAPAAGRQDTALLSVPAFEDMVRAAGSPVYPVRNSDACSYENLSRDGVVTSIDYKTLSLLQDGRLAFLFYVGREGSEKPVGNIVAVSLSGPGGRGRTASASLAPLCEALSVQPPNRLQVDHLESDGGTGIKVVYQPGAYAKPYSVVQLK